MVSHYTKAVFNKLSLLERLNEFMIYKNTRQIKVSELKFRTEIIKSEDYTPIFFLSTGRTGTDFFTKLLSKSSKYKIFHSPSNLICNAQSELIEQGKISYEFYTQFGYSNMEINILSSQIFLAARENLLYTTYIHNKNYIETNNRITFLAPALKFIFPKAKFVHLYRHPGEFIRSGIRRGYYSSKSIHELGRLVPIKNTSYFNQWDNFSEIKKIAWLWNETNLFIDNYLATLDDIDYFQFNFNDLNIENINKLLVFLDINDINQVTIKKLLSTPTNTQRKGTFPKYKDWCKEDKVIVHEICGELSLKYGYKL